MKKRLSFFIVLSLLFLLALPSFTIYKLNKSVPHKISLSENKKIEINLGAFISAKNKTDYCFSENGRLFVSCPTEESYRIDLRLFGLIPVKSMTVSGNAERLYIPSGQAIGIKLYTDGVLVVAINQDHPAYAVGIRIGDIITHVNDVRILNAVHFSSLINKEAKKGANIKIAFNRAGEKKQSFVTPTYSDGEYKIGAWVRDSSAGIGTMTYIDAESSTFGALGHAVCDSDTGSMLAVMQGRITSCSIIDAVKGEKGAAGRLCGVLQAADIGSVYKNCGAGIYGSIDAENISEAKPVRALSRFEIHEGDATILATVDDSGPSEYKVVIEKINLSDEAGASMIIKIADERLISKTGGIVQGMSGAPIIQNGKLAGAITHVFLNDPTRGYGIFIENMLDAAK